MAANLDAVKAQCMKEMREGGLTREARLACFDRFRAAEPTHLENEYFLDVWARDYEGDVNEAQFNVPAAVTALMCELFHPDRKRHHVKVLDVGAGTGLCGQLLHEAGFKHIDALDGSAMSLEMAKARGVYQHLYAELLEKGEPLETIPESTYDAVVSAGAFYPGLLDVTLVRSLIAATKKGGKVIIASSPHSDDGVGMRSTLHRLEKEGLVNIKREEYLPIFYQNDDGTLWEMEVLHGTMTLVEE